jgi:hypothetical protein
MHSKAMQATPYTNDGTKAAPALRFYLNEDNLTDLCVDTRWSGESFPACANALLADGFHGIQLTHSASVTGARIEHCTLDRINSAGDAGPVIARHAGHGHTCLTVHAGWGIEDDDTVFRMVEAILLNSEKHGLPVYIETHRATITQDMWRTVRIVEKFPEVRFNGDFSHYYTGQEMVYGGLQMKLDFMAPILERIAFMHARIGSPGNIQVAVGNAKERPETAVGDLDFLADFKAIWTLAMRGFKQRAGAGDYMIFCPELLSRQHYYARCFPNAEGQAIEESDRYTEALIYLDIARECWGSA